MRYLCALAILSQLLCNNKCTAQGVDSTKLIANIGKCWRVISYEYATIYGLEEQEIKKYAKQKLCFSGDSINLFYGASYAPKYSIRKVESENYAKDNFDCSKKKLGISVDSVYEVTIASVVKSLKKPGTTHNMTNVVVFDGVCIYAVVDGVIFRLFDADAKALPRASN